MLLLVSDEFLLDFMSVYLQETRNIERLPILRRGMDEQRCASGQIKSCCEDNCFWLLDRALDRLSRPSDLSCTVQLQVCAFFEPGPVLGRAMLLRKFNIRLGTLIKYSAASFCTSLRVRSVHNTETVVAITFLRKDVKVLSPCSSLEMTMKLVSPQEINAVAAWHVPIDVRRFYPSVSIDSR